MSYSPLVAYTKNGGASLCGSNSLVQILSVVPCKVGVLETMTDEATPHFRERQKRGELIFNPLAHEKRISSVDDAGQGYVRKQSPTPNCTISGISYFQEVFYEGAQLAYFVNQSVANQPIAVESGIISDKDVNSLITEISTKVMAARGQSSQNLWESTFEYKQTLALFHGPLKYLFRFFRKNGEKMRKMGPAEAWLAYRYGVKPFVEDMNAIVNGLKLPIGVRRETTREHGEISERSVTNALGGDNVAQVTINKLKTDLVSVRAMSIDEHVANLRDNIGFSSKGLITVPWDLIPFSFVLDWFVSLGDFLKAYAPTPGYKTIGACLTVERTIGCLYTATNSVCIFPNLILTRPVSGACSSTLWTKRRQPLASPGVVIRSDFRYASLIRVADTVALLSVIAASYFSGGSVLSRGSLANR